MKTSELRSLIREEIKKVLKEVDMDSLAKSNKGKRITFADYLKS